MLFWKASTFWICKYISSAIFYSYRWSYTVWRIFRASCYLILVFPSVVSLWIHTLSCWSAPSFNTHFIFPDLFNYGYCVGRYQLIDNRGKYECWTLPIPGPKTTFSCMRSLICCRWFRCSAIFWVISSFKQDLFVFSNPFIVLGAGIKSCSHQLVDINWFCERIHSMSNDYHGVLRTWYRCYVDAVKHIQFRFYVTLYSSYQQERWTLFPTINLFFLHPDTHTAPFHS